MLRTCNRCKIEKPIGEFYPSQHFGISYQCKDCDKKHAKKWHEKTGYFKTESGKAALIRASVKSKAKYPEKEKARTKLRKAIREGKIIKEPCKCGEVKVHGHHYAGYDGDNWSKVMWLCAKHHSELHSVRK